MGMTLKTRIEAEISASDLYGKFFELKKEGNYICPFHTDSNVSLSIDLKKGLWYCHSCKEGGDQFNFIMKLKDLSFPNAIKFIAKEFGIIKGKTNDTEIWHKKLMSSPHVLEACEARGISKAALTKYQIGWEGERLIIPMFKHTELVALRKYDILKKHKSKFTSVKGLNSTTLWPLSVFANHQTIWMLAGEPDTLTALSCGIPAATFTNGEGAFNEDYLPYFKEKNVYICFDIDTAGRKGAAKLASKIFQEVNHLRIIDLPEDGLPENGDFTDYAKLVNFDFNKLDLLRKDAREYDDALKRQVELESSESIGIHESTHSKYFDKRVATSGLLAGRGSTTYFAPRVLRASCSMDMGKDICSLCPMQARQGKMEVVTTDDNKILRLIDVDEKIKTREVMSCLRIPKCKKVYIDEREMQSVEYIHMIPDVDLDSEETFKQATLGAYTLNMPQLEDNQLYEMHGKITTDPKSQRMVFITDKAEQKGKSFTKYYRNGNMERAIKELTPPKQDLKSIDDYMIRRTKDIMVNVCGLVDRQDLIQVYDLVWHSVLTFTFQRRPVTKGWVEGLVLGDTRTGKSCASEAMIKHYNAGKYINCEGATLAGIIGGQNAYGSKLVFTWGVIPMQDGRLVVLDESQDLPIEIIGSLSAIRSRGVASRPIVGGERLAKSRVRLVWIANPRSSRTIKQYFSGIDAIRELIGKEEDIARFDMILLLAKEEVDDEKFFLEAPEVEHVWNSDISSLLVSWIWSRKRENIRFHAENSILKHAKEISDKYGAFIPTVQPSEMRIKMAKLAAAVAGLCFSTSDGENIDVLSCHSEYAMMFLDVLYSKKVFGSEVYEAKLQSRESNSKMAMQVKDLLEPYGQDGVNFLLRNNQLREKDFYYLVAQHSNDPRKDADKLVRKLGFEYKCMFRSKNFWIKDNAFTELLIQLRDKFGKESKMIDDLFKEE